MIILSGKIKNWAFLRYGNIHVKTVIKPNKAEKLQARREKSTRVVFRTQRVFVEAETYVWLPIEK